MGLAQYFAKKRIEDEARLVAVRNGTYEPKKTTVRGRINTVTFFLPCPVYSHATTVDLSMTLDKDCPTGFQRFTSGNGFAAEEWQALGLKDGDRVEVTFVSHNGILTSISRI